MKPYSELTPKGIKRRLRKVIELALLEYDIEYNKIEYFIEETNIFYKVYGSDGTVYGLKICQDESSTIEDSLAEIFILNTVKNNSDIVIPTVIKSKSHKGVTIINSKYTDAPKRIIIYKWLDGLLFDGNETNELFYLLGQTMAKLHVATQGTQIPQNISPKKWDKIFYFTDEEIVYNKDEYMDKISVNARKLLDNIIPFLDKELAKYYTVNTPQLIHGDINPWNVLLHNEELCLIDFEDVAYGYPLHDLAIALFYYKYNKNFDYNTVKKNIFAGYSSIIDLPTFTEYDIDLLIVARRVNFINYIMVIDENPKQYIERSIKRVIDFIDMYNITF